MRLLNRSAGRLSRHRRGPLAGLAVVLLGLLMTGGLYTVFSPAQAGSAAASEEQIAKGRELFLVSCSFCHGQNGEGIRTQNGNQLGPSLVGVGAAAVDFQVGTGRMPMARPGAQVPRKPETFNDDEIAALAAYVASLGPGPAIPDESDYSIEGLSDEERQQAITNGGQIFLTNCTACHNFEGSGGAMPRGGFAPKIRGVEPRYIYEALLTGPQNMPNFSNGNLSPDEKRDVIAYLASLEDMPQYGGFGLGGLGPVSEGAAAWVLGIGSLVGVAVWIAAHTTRSTKKKVEA
ncbi:MULTISPECIES: cytochrome c [unclassified Nocardioides]|uniref:cytochrome bc1 complex diheme cytochrome c subunit n=1 Tax=unclassified Nocardioides TaxID=2615069 RepID=UPI000056F302|nr:MULTISPECIES: cytochrome c [unclassified Nocardioides]ABL82637.1 menaquinol-cytochrome c reductase cytochrome c1 subunit precursor [Nocardioides sp. JS614]